MRFIALGACNIRFESGTPDKRKIIFGGSSNGRTHYFTHLVIPFLKTFTVVMICLTSKIKM